MFCIKCGTETEANQMFCQTCLQGMEKYPVKPGTAIHLPKRDPLDMQKRAARSKRPTGVEEQLQQLRARNRHLVIWLVLTATALLAAIAILLLY